MCVLNIYIIYINKNILKNVQHFCFFSIYDLNLCIELRLQLGFLKLLITNTRKKKTNKEKNIYKCNKNYKYLSLNSSNSTTKFV